VKTPNNGGHIISRLVDCAATLDYFVFEDFVRRFALQTSSVGIAAVLLQDQGGGPQPISYWASKRNRAERGIQHLLRVRFRSFGRT
jgi:hypothetical protein